jgi:hypothetical protein
MQPSEKLLHYYFFDQIAQIDAELKQKKTTKLILRSLPDNKLEVGKDSLAQNLCTVNR